MGYAAAVVESSTVKAPLNPMYVIAELDSVEKVVVGVGRGPQT